MPELILPHNHGEHIENITAAMPSPEQFQAVSDLTKQISDCSRLRIFWLLCHCRECVINISAILDMSSPAVSHHLKTLKKCGLIVSKREGKEVYYSAADTEAAKLFHDTIESILHMTCPKESE